MPDEIDNSITLFPNHLASLIFGTFADKDLPVCDPPLSKAPGDLATVRVTHYTIGQLIALRDVAELSFHVEFFELLTIKEFGVTKVIPRHAELWTAREWKDSNARRTRRQAVSAVERAERESLQELITILADELTAVSKAVLPDSFCNDVAITIAANYKTSDLSALIKYWKLDEAIAAFEERKKNEQKTTTHIIIYQNIQKPSKEIASKQINSTKNFS